MTPSQALRALPGDAAVPASADSCLSDSTAWLDGQLDLARAIAIALCRNPQSRLAQANILSQAAQVGQARAAYLPTVNLALSRSVDNSTTETTGEFASTSQSNLKATGRVATINWLLLDLGARAANVAQAQWALQAALASQDAAVQAVFGATAQAYYDTWAAQAAADSAALAEAGARETLQAAEARQRLGASAATDVLQARAALAQAALVRARAAGTLRLAAGAMSAALGLDARSTLTLIPDPALEQQVGTPAPTNTIALAEHLIDLDRLMNQALVDHPSVRAAQAQVAAAQARRDATVSDGLPSLSFSLGRFINGRPTTPLTAAQSHETLASLQLNIPLFDGFSRNYRIRDAEAQVAARSSDLATARVQASLEAWRNYQTLQAETASVAASYELLSSASVLADAARARYRAGAVDILETVTAERDLAGARQERIRALAAWRSSRLKLLASLGRAGFWALEPAGTPAIKAPAD